LTSAQPLHVLGFSQAPEQGTDDHDNSNDDCDSNPMVNHDFIDEQEHHWWLSQMMTSLMTRLNSVKKHTYIKELSSSLSSS
jgi:hypothetical protein